MNLNYLKTIVLQPLFGFTMLLCLTPFASNADYRLDVGVVSSPNNNHIELANIHFSSGSVVKFVLDQEDDELFIGEIIPVSDKESFYLNDELIDKTPVEIFTTLTPEYVAIPAALLDYSQRLISTPGDGGELVSSKAIQSEQKGIRALSSDSSHEIFVETSEITAQPIVKLAATGGSCGPDGVAYFTENHCDTMGPGGYGTSQTHCDAGLYSWIQRTSSKTMRHTYTRMATCGATGRLRHSRNTIDGFKTVLDYYQQPTFVSEWYSIKSGFAWKRRAKFDRTSNSGGVRGWTRFFKQLTH